MAIAIDLVGLALVAAGVFFAWRAFRERQAMRFWPSTQGEVTSSGVFQRHQPGGQGARMPRFEARYSYRVDERRSSGLLYSDIRRHHAALKAKYPSGAKIDVFYNPENPGRSDLREKLGVYGGVTPAIMAFFLLMIGAGVICVGLQMG